MSNIHGAAEEEFNGKGLVAFIDILGFSEEIMNKWYNNKENPLLRIKEIKRLIPTSDKKDIFIGDEYSHIYASRVQTISDSFFISFGFEEKDILNELGQASITLMDTITSIWETCLTFGFTIRGAIDYGDIYWNKNEIIGPAFINAYKQETKLAKTSRVIVLSNYNKILKDFFDSRSSSWNSQIISLFRKDIDGMIIYNPHELYNPNSVKPDQEKIKLLNRINEIRNLNHDKYIKEKYTPLLAALDSDRINIDKSSFGKY